MARGELSAQQAAGQLGGLMSAMAFGVVNGVMASGNAAAARREHRAVYDYAAALEHAKAHASDLEAIALEAMGRIADLEAEVARLTAACIQRQEHIEHLKERLHA